MDDADFAQLAQMIAHGAGAYAEHLRNLRGGAGFVFLRKLLQGRIPQRMRDDAQHLSGPHLEHFRQILVPGRGLRAGRTFPDSPSVKGFRFSRPSSCGDFGTFVPLLSDPCIVRIMHIALFRSFRRPYPVAFLYSSVI